MKRSKIGGLWKCPDCGRKFMRKGQVHSCKFVPIEQHFYHKEMGKTLFEKLNQRITKSVGPFTIDSLDCCIHLVNDLTFAAVFIFKDKIMIDFALKRKIVGGRVFKTAQLGANRYINYIEIHDQKEIDDQLIDWINEAYLLIKEKLTAL